MVMSATLLMLIYIFSRLHLVHLTQIVILSQAPAVSVIRRHTRSSNSSDDFHFAPALRVVSGNYVTSKRRGVVEGIDFGSTGTVRFVQHEAIHQQLDMGHVVLLSNLGYSASGEVLNCNTFDVATHAAIELKADKIMCITLDEVQSLNMPQWLSLNDAEALINERLAGVGDGAACSIDKTCPSLDGTAVPVNGSSPPSNGASNVYSSSNGNGAPTPAQLSNGSGRAAGGSRAQAVHEIELDLDCWQALNFPNALLTAVVGCKSGVKRAHLVDARQDGGLLLELYSRYQILTLPSLIHITCQIPLSLLLLIPLLSPPPLPPSAPVSLVPTAYFLTVWLRKAITIWPGLASGNFVS